VNISIAKLVEVSKFLATKSGTELREFVEYMGGMSEQVIRALKNGLTFRDNFDAEVLEVELTSGTAQIVGNKKVTVKPSGVLVQRVISSLYALDSFLWYLDGQNKLTVKATFTGSPTDKVTVSLIVLY
jgi:hypothetical protein